MPHGSQRLVGRATPLELDDDVSVGAQEDQQLFDRLLGRERPGEAMDDTDLRHDGCLPLR